MRDAANPLKDPFGYLEKDHKKVSALFKEMGATTPRAVKSRKELTFRLIELVTLHSELEKSVVYPLLEKVPETRERTLEAYEEHKLVEAMLEELEAADAESEAWLAKLTVLKENIEHHVKEEEDHLFKKGRKAIGKDREEQLGRAMERFLAHRGEGVSA